MMNFDHSSSRETCVRRERSKLEVTNVSATGGYSTDEASASSVVEASLGSRGVMREVRPNKESRKGMKEAAGLGEAKISASMFLRLTEIPKWGTLGRAQDRRSAARPNDVLGKKPFGF